MVKWIAQLLKDLSSRFYRKAQEVAEEKANTVRKDIATEKIKGSGTEAIPVSLSSDIILTKEESSSLNERLAHKIIQNGIRCKAVIDIGSLEIERKPYYSYLFPLSPRIITNRGCIKLEGNGTRNIDFIQIIQKN
jgi:phosphatidylinositol kinase/protein kinase (PI-3  family)